MLFRRPLWPLLLAAAVVSLCLQAPARAQEPTIPLWRAEVGMWTFAPAWSPGGGSLLGFLAWARTGATVGDNVSIVWCERQQNDEWTMHGWRTRDAISAVRHARATVNHPDLWSTHPDITALLAAAAPPTEPVPTIMTRGLFEGDPGAAALLNAPNPYAAIAAAIQTGYAAAPTLSPIASNTAQALGGDPCDPAEDLTTAALLNRLAAEAETAMFGQSSVTGATGDPCCWCPCTTTETNTGWIQVGSFIDGNHLRCCYRKGKEVVRTCTGQVLDTCALCDSATVLESDLVYGETIVSIGAPCPDYSQGGDPAAIYPTRPTWWP